MHQCDTLRKVHNKGCQRRIQSCSEPRRLPEISVRIGIDVGEIVVVQYGWNIQSSIVDCETRVTTKKAHYDIIGYTVSIASKITGIAEPNQIVVGQYVYNALDNDQKNVFKLLTLPSEVWNYLGRITGDTYKLYARLSS